MLFSFCWHMQTTPLEQLESKFRSQVVDRMDVSQAEVRGEEVCQALHSALRQLDARTPVCALGQATVEDDRKFIMSMLEKCVVAWAQWCQVRACLSGPRKISRPSVE